MSLNQENPDPHAQIRDVKAQKKHHLFDNRRSIQLIAKLLSRLRQPRNKKK